MIIRKPRAENIQFLLVGIMLILGGLQQSDIPVIRDLLMLIGILLLIYSFYCLFSTKPNPILKLFAMLGELTGLLTGSYILYKNGSAYLHLIYLLASMGIMIAIGVHHYKEVRTKKLSK